MEAESVYQYLIDRQEFRLLEEKDLYYVFLPVPEYWDIRVDGYNGAVTDMGEKKAIIYFKAPSEKRYVQRVEWITNTGTVYKIDYYGKYGYAYCTEYLNSDGSSRMKEYYTSQRKLVASKNSSNGVITLFEQGHVAAMYDSESVLIKEVSEETDGDICI